MLRHLQFWILSQGRFMPSGVNDAQQNRHQMPFSRRWMVGMVMAYVLVLQLVLTALASAGHAATRIDPAAPLRTAILCGMPGQPTSSVPDMPPLTGEACASFCSPLPLHPAGSTALPAPHHWHLPARVLTASALPGHLRRDAASEQQPRAPPA